jgi:hypothetical protein
VAHPSSPSSVSALSPLASTRRREAEKQAYYAQLGSQLGARVVPFILESYGAFGARATSFLSDLSSYSREAFSPPSQYSSVSLLSVVLQKGNVDMLAHGCLRSRVSVAYLG